MRILILSDLHLEFAPFEILISRDFDIVVLAGDIHQGTKGIDWAKRTFPDIPVLYVIGNHEFYHNAIPGLFTKLKKAAESSNVTIMENDTFYLEKVRFLGCTLWTNFTLYQNNPVIGTSVASTFMADYRYIRVGPKYRKLEPEDTIRYYAQSVNWLDSQFTQKEMTTVIITHHAPSPKSIHPMYHNSPVNAAFASNLEDKIKCWNPVLWVHGHMHHATDYMINTTRIICNPRGYPDEHGTNFMNDCIVSI
jgi:Icc-related predicted phosphoesterase